MAAIFMIIGAAVGGALGWLLDRRAEKGRAGIQDTCEPTST